MTNKLRKIIISNKDYYRNLHAPGTPNKTEKIIGFIKILGNILYLLPFFPAKRSFTSTLFFGSFSYNVLFGKVAPSSKNNKL